MDIFGNETKYVGSTILQDMVVGNWNSLSYTKNDLIGYDSLLAKQNVSVNQDVYEEKIQDISNSSHYSKEISDFKKWINTRIYNDLKNECDIDDNLYAVLVKEIQNLWNNVQNSDNENEFDFDVKNWKINYNMDYLKSDFMKLNHSQLSAIESVFHNAISLIQGILYIYMCCL